MEEKEPEKIEKIVEKVRDVLVKIAVEKYEDASIAGLCTRGAWEASIDALKNTNLTKLLIEIDKKDEV